MKIELNHELEDITEILETGKFTDIPEGVELQEIKDTLLSFNGIFQAFEVGTLVAYLSTSVDEEIGTMSKLMEVMVGQLGWEKFANFYGAMNNSYQETIEQYKKEQEAEQATDNEAEEGDNETDNGTTDNGTTDDGTAEA